MAANRGEGYFVYSCVCPITLYFHQMTLVFCVPLFSISWFVPKSVFLRCNPCVVVTSSLSFLFSCVDETH